MYTRRRKRRELSRQWTDYYLFGVVALGMAAAVWLLVAPAPPLVTGIVVITLGVLSVGGGLFDRVRVRGRRVTRRELSRPQVILLCGLFLVVTGFRSIDERLFFVALALLLVLVFVSIRNLTRPI